jgi:hypothetical protein
MWFCPTIRFKQRWRKFNRLLDSRAAIEYFSMLLICHGHPARSVAYCRKWRDRSAIICSSDPEGFALYELPLVASSAWRFAMTVFAIAANKSNIRRRIGCAAATAAALLACADIARADEGGVSFWLPGQYASFAATPGVLGWALGVIYYHTNVEAFGSVAASKEITAGRIPVNANVNLNLSLAGQGDLVILAPTYIFAQPVLGGQLSVGVSSWFGQNAASIAGTLTASVGSVFAQRTGMISDSLTSYGDIVPTATLRWHQGVNNFMVYVTGDIPAGDYDPMRLANLGIGHGAIDSGGAYTYLNPLTGNEFSATAGFTYNFKNPDTQYRSGIDFHFDWGASHFLSKQLYVGLAGYAYQQVTDDSGQNPILGGFRSRVLGVGPQIGYLFPVGGMQGLLSLRGYGEFDSANRPQGWNTWLTFAISQAAPTATTPAQHLITK